MSDTKREAQRDAFLDRARREILIMGILNTTPDSFSDGGQFDALDAALARAAEMEREGVDVVDIGGESTRPGAAPVPEVEEWARVIPVVRGLHERSDTPLSIDTYKSGVARAAADVGAAIVNDVWGFTRDPDMARIVAETESAAVITYNRGEADDAINLVDDLRAFFDRVLSRAQEAGVPRERIVLDPGVGFSKTYEQNFEVLRRLDVLLDYGLPVLVGLSRKSFIGRLTGAAVDQRLSGSLAAHLACVHRGASVLRVHDVAAHKQALAVYTAISRPD